MQLSLLPDGRTEYLSTIHTRLYQRFGRPGPYHHLDPVSQLVMGLIGGRTRSEVSLVVFGRLVKRFTDWEALRDAPVSDISQIMAEVTFAEVKAPRLKAALHAITAQRGALTLDFLNAYSVPAALGWLERLPGVGRKTAATVLNFSTLRKPALVIDTHHLRVARRTGLVGKHSTIEQAHELLAPLLPLEWDAADLDDLHQLMKLLGQRYCGAAVADCAGCPLKDLCPAGSVT